MPWTIPLWTTRSGRALPILLLTGLNENDLAWSDGAFLRTPGT